MVFSDQPLCRQPPSCIQRSFVCCVVSFLGLRPQTPTGALPLEPRLPVPTLPPNPGYATAWRLCSSHLKIKHYTRLKMRVIRQYLRQRKGGRPASINVVLSRIFPDLIKIFMDTVFRLSLLSARCAYSLYLSSQNSKFATKVDLLFICFICFRRPTHS